MSVQKNIKLNAARFRTAFIFAALFAFLLSSHISAASPKQKLKTTSGDLLVITTDSAMYSIDDDSFSIPGDVTIEMPDTKITGKNLMYNNKTGKGELSGEPLTVKYTRAGVTVLTANGITFDSASRTARMTGGVDVLHSTSTVVAKFHSASIDIDFTSSVAEASGKVTLELSDSAAEKSRAASAAAGVNSASMPFATTPAVFTADFIRYNMKTGVAVTGDNPTVRLPDATLLSKNPIKVSLKDKTAEATGGLDFYATPDVYAHADRANVWYGDRLAVLSGHVTGRRGNSSVSAASIRIDYGKTGASINFTGGVRIQMNVKSASRGADAEIKSGGCGEYSTGRLCAGTVEP